MFCEKCGAQIPDGAKFCEHCGNSTEAGAPAAEEAFSAAPAAPSAFGIALKKFFSKKKNIAIVAAALLLVVAVIVAVIIIASQPKKIYIDDYFTVEFHGVDGYGRAELTATDEQNKAFDKLNDEIFPAGNHHLGSLLMPVLDITDDERNSLKNGDKVKVKIEFNEDFSKYVDGYKFVLRNDTVTVSGLKQVESLNIAASLPVSFNGVNGYARFDTSDEIVTVNDKYKLEYDFSYGELTVHVNNMNDERITNVYYSCSEYNDLSNGDKVSFTYSGVSYSTQDLLNNYGIMLDTNGFEVEVAGLKEAAELDFAEHVKVSFEGYSGLAEMIFNISEEKIVFDGYSILVEGHESYYSTSVSVTFYDEYDNYVTELYFYPDKESSFANGDTVTFKNEDDSFEYLIRELGVYPIKEFSVQVSGLTEPISPDVLGKGEMTFTGYNGYGKLNYKIDDADCVYTIDGFKFKITPSVEGNYIYLNVVVENPNGENFISLNYTIYTGYNLSNEDELTIRCDTYESTLLTYLNDYGIYFPYSVTYTVTGLPEATLVKPLDYVTFSTVAGENGPEMVATLKEESFTVNGYTFTLSLSNYSGWFGSEYININFVVTDEEGNECGSGYYQIEANELTEGETVTTSLYFSDASTLQGVHGLNVSSEKVSVIVSTK